MRKYLYTTLLLALLAQEGVMAQENEGKKGGFFGKIKDTFSTEIKIGNYTFKDGSVYTGEMNGRQPHGKGKTVFKNGDVFEGEFVKGKREEARWISKNEIDKFNEPAINDFQDTLKKVFELWDKLFEEK